MKTLFGGRSTAGSKLAAIALFTTLGLGALAGAQDVGTTTNAPPSPPPTASLPAPFNSLDPSKMVISCNAGPNQSAEAGVGVVNFNGSITNGYTSDPPPTFVWINVSTNQVDEVGQDSSETAPGHSTTFVLIVIDWSTGNWGESTFAFTATDTTAPQIWLLGDPTVFVTCGTPYFKPGYGVFDNADGASVPVTIAGSPNTNVPGVYHITYTATDSHNNSASVSRTINVVYSWTGLQQPVDLNGLSVFHINSCVPCKFQLTGPCANLTNVVAKLYLAKVSNSVAGTEIVADSKGNADVGNIFRCANGNYSFNLDTKGLTAGTWQLRVDMGDGAIHAVMISLTK